MTAAAATHLLPAGARDPLLLPIPAMRPRAVPTALAVRHRQTLSYKADEDSDIVLADAETEVTS